MTPSRRPARLATLSLSLAAASGTPPTEGTAVRSAALDDDGPRGARVGHVLLLSIDGFHQVDLQNFIAAQPASALARLAAGGVVYTNAWVNRLDGTATNPS